MCPFAQFPAQRLPLLALPCRAAWGPAQTEPHPRAESSLGAAAGSAGSRVSARLAFPSARGTSAAAVAEGWGCRSSGCTPTGLCPPRPSSWAALRSRGPSWAGLQVTPVGGDNGPSSPKGQAGTKKSMKRENLRQWRPQSHSIHSQVCLAAGGLREEGRKPVCRQAHGA